QHRPPSPKRTLPFRADVERAPIGGAPPDLDTSAAARPLSLNANRGTNGRRMRAPTLRLLGDYAVEGQVGEGTSGHVYRAVHVPTARPVALKVLRRVPDVNPSDRIAEAELLRGVRHPGILSVE